VKDMPLITVITATYNAASELHHTINSIRLQNGHHIQWIVADGGSTDSTIEILKANEDIIDTWFSERDNGIYDAWNKALKYAKGEWVQFLGAGDAYASDDVINKMILELKLATPQYTLVYGNLQYVAKGSRKVLETVIRPWSEIKGRWEFFRPKLPVHPEVFHHISLFSGEGFSTKYKIAGDSHFLLRAIKDREPKHVDILVDIMPVGGASWGLVNTRMIKEIFSITKELGLKPPVLHVLYEGMKVFVKIGVIKCFSPRKVFQISDWFRVLRGLDRRWTVD